MEHRFFKTGISATSKYLADNAAKRVRLKAAMKPVVIL